MHPGAFARLDEEIWQYYAQHKQSDDVLRLKQNVLNEFRGIAHQAFGGLRNVNLVMCGSSANGCGTSSSDLNLCLQVGEASCAESDAESDTEKLLLVLEQLEKTEGQRAVRIYLGATLLRDRVPIIRLRTHCFAVDICCDDRIAYRTARLISNYALLDTRFPELTIYVNKWAVEAGIKGHRCLSSYALTLMAIVFLQCGVDPPVLPNLQLNRLRRPANVVEHIPANIAKNEQSTGKLLFGFYKFFATFDFGTYGISVCTGGKCARPEDQKIQFFIEEPCCPQRPVVCIQEASDLTRVQDAFRREAARFIELFPEVAPLELPPVPSRPSVPEKASEAQPAAVSEGVDVTEARSPDTTPGLEITPAPASLDMAQEETAEVVHENIDDARSLEISPAIEITPKPTAVQLSPVQPAVCPAEDTKDAHSQSIPPVMERTPAPEPLPLPPPVKSEERRPTAITSPAIDRLPTPPAQLPTMPPTAPVSKDLRGVHSEATAEKVPTAPPAKLPQAQPAAPKKQPPTAVVNPQPQAAKKAVASAQQPKAPVNPEPKPSLVPISNPVRKQKAEAKEKPVQQSKTPVNTEPKTSVIKLQPQVKAAKKVTAPPPRPKNPPKQQAPPPSAPVRRLTKKTDLRAAAAALTKNPSTKPWVGMALSFGVSVLVILMAVAAAVYYSPDELTVRKKSFTNSLPEEFYGKFVFDPSKPAISLNLGGDDQASDCDDPMPDEIEFTKSTGDIPSWSYVDESIQRFDLRTQGDSIGVIVRTDVVPGEQTVDSELEIVAFDLDDGILREERNYEADPKVYIYVIVDEWLRVQVNQAGVSTSAYYRRV